MRGRLPSPLAGEGSGVRGGNIGDVEIQLQVKDRTWPPPSPLPSPVKGEGERGNRCSPTNLTLTRTNSLSANRRAWSFQRKPRAEAKPANIDRTFSAPGTYR